MVSKYNNIHQKPTRQVGFVLKPHGYGGQLRISIDDDYQPQDFLLIEINQKFVPFAIESFNPDACIIKLSDLNSIDSVQNLLNLPIIELIDRVENNTESLLGYTLTDSVSGQSFEVTNILEYPGNTLLEFRFGFKDALIPLHEDIVTEINHETKTILARFPDGILEL